MLTRSGLDLRGLAAAVEQRTGEFRPVLLRGETVEVAGPWERVRGWDAMFSRADALLRRHINPPVKVGNNFHDVENG